MSTEAFPVDYTEFMALWREWKAEVERAGHVGRSTYRFPAKNFLADEILAVWSVNGRQVELSALTMPDLVSRPERLIRFIGITFGTAAGTDVPDNPIVASFAELETELGIRQSCRHCHRTIVKVDGAWIDPEATGDDSMWRETCDSHDTFTAEHEPEGS